MRSAIVDKLLVVYAVFVTEAIVFTGGGMLVNYGQHHGWAVGAALLGGLGIGTANWLIPDWVGYRAAKRKGD